MKKMQFNIYEFPEKDLTCLYIYGLTNDNKKKLSELFGDCIISHQVEGVSTSDDGSNNLSPDYKDETDAERIAENGTMQAEPGELPFIDEEPPIDAFEESPVFSDGSSHDPSSLFESNTADACMRELSKSLGNRDRSIPMLCEWLKRFSDITDPSLMRKCIYEGMYSVFASYSQRLVSKEFPTGAAPDMGSEMYLDAFVHELSKESDDAIAAEFVKETSRFKAKVGL